VARPLQETQLDTRRRVLPGRRAAGNRATANKLNKLTHFWSPCC